MTGPRYHPEIKPHHRKEGICSWCGGPVPKGRHLWCGQGCIDAYTSAKGYGVRDATIRRNRNRNGQTLRCEICQQETVPSECAVDHKVPLALGGSLDDPENLQVLCEKCHKRKTRRDIRAIRRNRRVDMEGQVLLDAGLGEELARRMEG